MSHFSPTAVSDVSEEPAAPSKARTPHLLEYIGVYGFFALCAALSWKSWTGLELSRAGWLAAAVLLGYIGADFFSGLVHWLFDTWGSPDTPVVGKNFIIPFRVHHSDPKDITLHGFIATNGHNCLSCIPVLAAGLLLPTHAEWTPPALAFIVSLCMGIFATNQFHKWAHFEPHELSPAIRLLQRMHLILPIAHHDVHHTAPYERHYCITSGWLNVPLNTLGFFRGVERAITAVTGVQPRKDDLKDKKL